MADEIYQRQLENILEAMQRVRKKSMSFLVGDAIASMLYGGNDLGKNGMVQKMLRERPDTSDLLALYKSKIPIKFRHRKSIEKMKALYKDKLQTKSKKKFSLIAKITKKGGVTTTLNKSKAKLTVDGLEYIPGRYNNVGRFFEVVARARSRSYAGVSIMTQVPLKQIAILDNFATDTKPLADHLEGRFTKQTSELKSSARAVGNVIFKRLKVEQFENDVVRAVIADRQAYYDRAVAKAKQGTKF